MKSVAAAILVLCLFSGIQAAAQDIRRQPVRFKPGEIGATIKGKVKGSQIVDYLLRAQAGQTVAVILESSSAANYFNVTAPSAETAMFTGSTSGRYFVGKASKDGEYTVRVYLMRSAARRGEAAAYTLHVVLAGADLSNAAVSPAAGSGPTKYDASGKVKCSTGAPALDKWCDFRVMRDLPRKAADIWISNAASRGEGRYRFLHYEIEAFTTDDKAGLSWQRQDDNWWVGVDGKEFYLIPDALIHGG